MTFVCASCKRRLIKPAAFSMGKPVGPKCAQKMGLIEPKRKGVESRGVVVLDGQMKLELEVAE